MTLHTAKGLEFPVVFLTGDGRRRLPHMRSLSDPKELEEERRLAYVGITRAEKRLYLSRAAVRTAWGAPPSTPPPASSPRCRTDLIEWRNDPKKNAWGAATKRETRPLPSRGGGKPVLQLSPGDRVTHDQLGLGTVMTVEGEGAKTRAKIDFGSAGEKTLMVGYAKTLEKL